MCRYELQSSKGTNQRSAPVKGRCGCMDTPLLQVVRLLSSGGKYGERKRRDFFVKHLLNIQPPIWNR